MLVDNYDTSVLPNESNGRRLIITFLVFLVSIISLVVLILKSPPFSYFITLFGLLATVAMIQLKTAIGMIKSCTILPLYAAGYIIARFVKTPPFLDKDTYFPNYI